MSKHTSRKATAKHSKKANFLHNLAYLGHFDTPTKVEMIQYDAHKVVKKTIQNDQQMRDEIHRSSISWFRITGFSDINRISNICNTFGIHRFDIKDLFSNLHLTKIVTYDNATFVMMSGCFMNEDNQLDVEQIAFILGKNFVISFQEAPSPLFADVITAIEESRAQLREKKADYLLYILLNGVHSLFIDAISKINEQIDEAEDALIDQQSTDKSIMQFFREKRKNYALIRRSLMPIREEFDNLQYNSNKLIDENSMIYFNDFDDRLRTTLDELELLNESMSSLMDLYFNNNNLKMNDVMKRLTVVSTIFIPLTFMAGVWGMNFKIMPELEWEYGYFVSLGSMIVVAIFAIWFLKKKRWF